MVEELRINIMSSGFEIWLRSIKSTFQANMYFLMLYKLIIKHGGTN